MKKLYSVVFACILSVTVMTASIEAVAEPLEVYANNTSEAGIAPACAWPEDESPSSNTEKRP